MGQMTITNQFVTAGDFWTGMLEPNYKAQARRPGSLRAALHAAISLFYMSDWVFIPTRARYGMHSKFRRRASDLNRILQTPLSGKTMISAGCEAFAMRQNI